jgi:hypothetical protein
MARLEPRGAHGRAVRTQGDQAVRLRRDYVVCPSCGAGLFPLDEELALPRGPLSPRLEEGLVRLGTWLPSFAQAARALAYFTGVEVSEPTARRRTEAAGAVAIALHDAEDEAA